MSFFTVNPLSTPLELFVGPLPQRITHSHLRHYFQGFERCIQIDIRRLTHTGRPFTFALVTVSNTRIGKKLIEAFDGKLLYGSPVFVRPFIHRASGNERRTIGWRNRPWKFFNRRRGVERRMYRELASAETVQTQKSPAE